MGCAVAYLVTCKEPSYLDSFILEENITLNLFRTTPLCLIVGEGGYFSRFS